MADFLNKDPKVYQEEYMNFMKDLKNFHDSRGTSFNRLPKINGREVDLYLLYTLVTQHGGWEKVNINGDWELLLPYFGLHRMCCNGPVALKQVYVRYLDVYERVNFLGEEVDRREAELHEEDDTRSRRKALRALHALPITYNAAQHQIPDSVRMGGGYSTDLYTPPSLERLYQSLICPLPNEQDFGINVCTLLAMENRRPLDLSRYPKIVDALVAHAGISSQISVREVLEDSYKRIRRQNNETFWQDVIADRDIAHLASDEFLAATRHLEILPSSLNSSLNGADASSAEATPPSEEATPPSEETTPPLEGTTPQIEDSLMETEAELTTDEAINVPEAGIPGEPGISKDCPPAEVPGNLEEPGSSDQPEVSTETGIPGEPGTSEEPEPGTVPEPGTERKPKSRLPPAVLKPDNPRAVRYWTTLKKAAASAYFGTDTGDPPKLTAPKPPIEKDPEIDEDLFQLGRDLGIHDGYGQRVLQILSIIRNLSFDEMNAVVLAQNEACLRLILLCAHAKWGNLAQLAMDALSNLANEIKLEEPADSPLSAVLLGTVSRCIHSEDRFMVISCLEILNRLSQKDENESLLTAALDQEICSRICSYLTVPDVALLIYTLECIYALTSLGQTICNGFLHCPGLLECLVSLLTVEAQSFGPKACILMRVVETVSETEAVGPVVHAPLVPMTPHMNIAVAPRPVTHSPAPSAPATPPPAALAPATPQPATPAAAAATAAAKKSSNSRPGTPTSTKPSSSMLTFPEKEQAAVSWLKSAYEPVMGAPSLEQSILYKQYVTACGKLSGARQVLAAGQFYNCVRSAFGANVGPFRKQINSGVEFYFEGISPKQQTSSTSACSSPTPEVPSSPILKAQLSAPPKGTRKEPIKQSTSHPHLSQALASSVQQPQQQSPEAGGAAPSSSLIKSLLANKVPDGAGQRVNHVTSGLCPTATTLPGMSRTNSNSMSMPHVVVAQQPTAESIEVAQRQQQQKLQQQTQQPNGPCKVEIQGHSTAVKVNGVCSPSGESDSGTCESESKSKGMLADLLEREVKKETVNGSPVPNNKEIRISEKGLELVPKEADSKPIAVDMGVVGMDLGVDLGDGGVVPKSAHMIAQVNDAGHVEIHLEEEPDSSLCNGQALLDALEGKTPQVSSSSDSLPCKAVKRPADSCGDPEIPAKKPNPGTNLSNDSAPADQPSSILDKAIELTLTEETKDSAPPAAATQTNGVFTAPNAIPVAPPQQQTYVLAPNTTRAYLIVQQQNPRLPAGPQGQRFLLAIPRPGGGMVPASVVAISSSQLPTNGMATVTSASSTEGVVTFSGGAVAFPARSSEVPAPNPILQSVTITPVPSVGTSATTAATLTTTIATTTAATKKRNNSSGSESGGTKPRCRTTQKTKSTESQTLTPSPATPAAVASSASSPLPDGTLQYLCEWGGCMKTFKTPQEVYHHACHTHCPVNVDELPCLWERCDGLKRRRFSMMTHLMDRHCNEEVQRLMAVRRHQLSLQGKSDIPVPQLPPPHPGYAPHAALQAIKRHAAELMNHKELTDEKEGPVTKSIRLTSALILRNFATYSSLGRRLMRRHESLLAGVALSNVESSRTVSQILFELVNQGS